jgi:hypothetical protein
MKTLRALRSVSVGQSLASSRSSEGSVDEADHDELVPVIPVSLTPALLPPQPPAAAPGAHKQALVSHVMRELDQALPHASVLTIPCLQLAMEELLDCASPAEALELGRVLVKLSESKPWVFLARSPSALDALGLAFDRAVRHTSSHLADRIACAPSALVLPWIRSLFHIHELAQPVRLLVLGTFLAQGHAGLCGLGFNLLSGLLASPEAARLDVPPLPTAARARALQAQAERLLVADPSKALLVLSRPHVQGSCGLLERAASHNAFARVLCYKPALCSNVSWIGFDVDHTLAQYADDAVDKVTLDAAVAYLASSSSSPPAQVDALCHAALLLAQRSALNVRLKYLAVDYQNGNLLKLDAQHRVAMRMHGSRLAAAPPGTPAPPNLSFVNTHFERTLGGAFAHVVDGVDAASADVAERAALYESCYKRLVGGLSHAQSTACAQGLSEGIASGTVGVVKLSGQFRKWLVRLRERGYGLFVLSDAKMSHMDAVLGRALGSGWPRLFDIVVCDAKKASFFVQSPHAAGARVLTNSPSPGANARSIRDLLLRPQTSSGGGGPVEAKFMEGGSLQALMSAMLDVKRLASRRSSSSSHNSSHNSSNISSSPGVVFFGDHLVKDLCAPAAAGWRTVGVLPELGEFLAAHRLLGGGRGSIRSTAGAPGPLGDSFLCEQGALSLLAQKLMDSTHLCLPSVESAAVGQMFLVDDWHPGLCFPDVVQMD